MPETPFTAPASAAPSATELLERCTADLLRRTEMPVAFGGLVSSDQKFLSITSLRGTRTTSLANLRVRSGEGLGGKSLALRRPTAVRSYLSARGITRRYDHAVAPEQLETTLALPVALPGRDPLAVVYLADRTEMQLSDRLRDAMRPALMGLAHELQVLNDVNRRMEAVRRELAQVTPYDCPGVRNDVRALIESTTDPATRAGLQVLLGRLSGVPSPAAGERMPSPLTTRETEVLRHAETGATNREIAQALSLTDLTVKSYMKAAMAKLGAANRVRACRIARERGYLG